MAESLNSFFSVFSAPSPLPHFWEGGGRGDKPPPQRDANHPRHVWLFINRASAVPGGSRTKTTEGGVVGSEVVVVGGGFESSSSSSEPSPNPKIGGHFARGQQRQRGRRKPLPPLDRQVRAGNSDLHARPRPPGPPPRAGRAAEQEVAVNGSVVAAK